MENICIAVMSTFNWMFDKNRFTVYKTWRYDSSVVYRLTTWTNTAAYLGNLLRLGIKMNVIFLKVSETRLCFRLRCPQARRPRARPGSTKRVIQHCKVHGYRRQPLGRRPPETISCVSADATRRTSKSKCWRWGIRKSSQVFGLQMAEKLRRKTWMHSLRRTSDCN